MLFFSPGNAAKYIETSLLFAHFYFSLLKKLSFDAGPVDIFMQPKLLRNFVSLSSSREPCNITKSAA